jgi:hypothetical protein
MTELVSEDIRGSASPATPGDTGAPAPASAAVLWAVVLAYVLTGALLAGLLLLVNRPEWWQGFIAAAMINLLSTAFSLPPLLWGLRGRLMHAVGGYFVSAAVRMLIVIGGFLLAVLAGGYEPIPTVVLMMVFYLVLLGVESAWLARAMWNMKAD